MWSVRSKTKLDKTDSERVSPGKLMTTSVQEETISYQSPHSADAARRKDQIKPVLPNVYISPWDDTTRPAAVYQKDNATAGRS